MHDWQLTIAVFAIRGVFVQAIALLSAGSFPVTAVIQNQINHTAAQGKHSVAVMLSCRCAKATKTHAGFAEKPAQVNAAGCDKPTEQQPEGGLGQDVTITVLMSANLAMLLMVMMVG